MEADMALCVDTSIRDRPFAIATISYKPFAIAHISPCSSINHKLFSNGMFSISPAPRNSAQQISLVLTTDDPDADLTADTLTLEFFDKSIFKSSGVGITNSATSTAQRLEAKALILPSDWAAAETAGLSFGEREITVLANLWLTRGTNKALIATGQFKSLPNAEVIP
jgi:hypothetical protein